MSKRKPSSELEKQQALWYEKLKSSGFVDIEDHRQNLKTPETRTIAYQNQDIILAFFLKLDSYLNEVVIDDYQRLVLELYSDGVYITQIAKKVGRSRKSIYKVINRHKKEVLNGHLI